MCKYPQMPEEVIRCAGIRVTGVGWDLNLGLLGEKQSFSNTETPLWPPINPSLDTLLIESLLNDKYCHCRNTDQWGKKNPVSTLIEPNSIREGKK